MKNSYSSFIFDSFLFSNLHYVFYIFFTKETDQGLAGLREMPDN
jgi:hypothetical protein